MWTCINMQKIKLFHWFVLENPEQILIKESCNLIGREHFGPYPSNKNFPKYLCRNTANNLNFHYRTNSVKSNDQNFQYIQKKTLFLAYFWSIFPVFGAKRFFPKNLAVMRNFILVSNAMPKFIKKTDTIPRKYLDRRKHRRLEGQR